MPNQLNYPDTLESSVNQRPNRVAMVDTALMRNSKQQILFGTSNRDNIEFWVYEPAGSLTAHINIKPSDTALSLTTVVDNTGTYELLNVDMKVVSQRMKLEPGRYVMVGNFFRDEVGSEDGYKLYISEISSDRTELRLEPVTIENTVIKDIYEFITPSVPREFAQGLIAEVLGQAQQAPEPEVITHDKVAVKLGDDTLLRVVYSDTYETYQNLLNTVLNRTYRKALDLMAVDVFNYYVQNVEIVDYVERGLDFVLSSMIAAGEVDSQFELI